MLSASTRLQFVKQVARSYATKVSSKDGTGKISRVAVKVNAGSQYATKDGISHLLSRFNFQNTTNKSALRLVRESELLGGNFKSFVNRENIILEATFLKEDLPYFVNALGNVLYKTSFKEYELDEQVLPAAKHDLLVHNACPVRKAEDLLYNVTFRNGLGNPVYYDGVENITLEDIKSFADKVYVKDNIEVIGQGVNEGDLKRFVGESLLNSLPTAQSLAKTVPPKTFNGETRLRNIGDSVAAIAVPIAPSDFATYEVLAKYLSSPLSDLSSLIFKVKLDKYSTSGLFSLYVKAACPKTVSANIKKIVTELKAGKDISVAKNYAATQLALENQTSISPVQLNLDSVSNFQLGKFNYVAVGKVTQLPYADEL
ncbi:probable Cytochrome b-c1 complex subunit 2, mitochondrial [Saccharomycodes ludwigii]|uniref:Cytochrome b-c1 complex subunit 2, mitochondrial n=1 Tax=Saccharomycodes ludwigii TaxID=36035 RepID=A0A376B472_9ASCO|nr:probable Cytochrome b-c1 complex subunit 2, mitochondrial [Saccharomycodes ludwigii]